MQLYRHTESFEFQFNNASESVTKPILDFLLKPKSFFLDVLVLGYSFHSHFVGIGS